MSEDVQALVEQVRAGLTIPDRKVQATARAALDSLTAALERAERERDEARDAVGDYMKLYYMKLSGERADEAVKWRVRAQKAEAVVEEARRYNKRKGSVLDQVLTAYDEPPTEQA